MHRRGAQAPDHATIAPDVLGSGADVDFDGQLRGVQDVRRAFDAALQRALDRAVATEQLTPAEARREAARRRALIQCLAPRKRPANCADDVRALDLRAANRR